MGKIELLVITGGFFLLLFLIVFYLKIRESPDNNLRWASRHHLLGEREYARGNIEDADYHYTLARIYRETVFKGDDDGMV